MQDNQNSVPDPAQPPTPNWVGGKEWETDRVATNEDLEWPDQAALEGTRAISVLRFIQHSGWIGVGLMWFFAFVFVASMSIWLWHFLTPWEWLADEQLSKIQTVIFSGSLGAVVTTFAQKHIALGPSRE